MTSAPLKPCGTMIALTVSECHLGSLAQSLSPHALTAARDARDRAHAIDIEKRRVTCGIHGAADRSHVARDAGCRLVMDDHDALYLVILIFAERLLDLVGMDARAPLFLLDDDFEAMAASELDPEARELAEAGSEQLVTGRAGIGER